MRTPETSSGTAIAPRLLLSVIVILVIAGLATLDRFLANAQEAEVQHVAQQSHLDGLRLRRAGKIKEAIEAFRRAHALERQDTGYELDLIDALLDGGKPDQAELLIRDVLEREPNDGRTNLLAAHLMLARGKTAEAESYYHRAVYGEWPSDPNAHRVAVRMELADFLAAKGKQQELLAELLPLQEEVGKNDRAAEKRIAQLFLAAGSPSRAVDEYRALIKQNPKDASAYASLGDAELQLGEYGLARDAFRTAAAQKPNDASIRQRLSLSGTLKALDPRPRRLPSMEKYRRSLEILGLAQFSLNRCVTDHPALASGDTQQLLTSANEALTNQPRTGITNEIAEQSLGLAEKTWQARIKVCGGAILPDEEPLSLIMEKLAQ